MHADRKLFTHVLIDALPGEEWHGTQWQFPAHNLGSFNLYQHRFIWTHSEPWRFTGLQATLDFTDNKNSIAAKLRMLVQSQLYVRFIVGDKIYVEMCGAHLVEDVKRRYYEIGGTKHDVIREITETKAVFPLATTSRPDDEGCFPQPPGFSELETDDMIAAYVSDRHPVLHGRLCITIPVPRNQACELEVELHDCGNASLAQELRDTTNRRLITLDVYGIGSKLFPGDLCADVPDLAKTS